MARLGIIGGSGLYEIEGMSNVREERVTTPFGDPSDAYILGELDGVELVFLPRHGRGHKISPTEINYRANIFGMKLLGVTKILSISAVGSMKENIPPRDIVIPDQFIDLTRHRINSFFQEGIVAHVSVAEPVCASLGDVVEECARQTDTNIHRGGTYLNMEGPQFSSKAESLLYRTWGIDVIGMTNATEAKLAREAEICYTTLALSTDYDCWHEEEEAVSVEAVIAIVHENVERAKAIIKSVAGKARPEAPCGCHEALKFAIITNPEAIAPEVKERLQPLIGKYVT